jgi:hypothetical protein
MKHETRASWNPATQDVAASLPTADGYVRYRTDDKAAGG